MSSSACPVSGRQGRQMPTVRSVPLAEVTRTDFAADTRFGKQARPRPELGRVGQRRTAAEILQRSVVDQHLSASRGKERGAQVIVGAGKSQAGCDDGQAGLFGCGDNGGGVAIIPHLGRRCDDCGGHGSRAGGVAGDDKRLDDFRILIGTGDDQDVFAAAHIVAGQVPGRAAQLVRRQQHSHHGISPLRRVPAEFTFRGRSFPT